MIPIEGLKNDVRRGRIAWRCARPAEWRLEADRRISRALEKLVSACARHGGLDGALGVYYPIRGEPDLRALYACWQSAGLRLALPVVTGLDRPLRFCRWSVGSRLIRSPLGVPEPEHCVPVVPAALLIPCVAFSPSGHRLGYGGGFYDRTLANFDGFTLGVAYDEDEWPGFAAESHDRALDLIVTPTRILRPGLRAAAR
ncbi:MAG: 5-formyltetrahydrofolate cyclo-ligase [Burkholderiaceae bacterium]